MSQKLSYARWKAADGAKALREGRTPTSGPRMFFVTPSRRLQAIVLGSWLALIAHMTPAYAQLSPSPRSPYQTSLPPHPHPSTPHCPNPHPTPHPQPSRPTSVLPLDHHLSAHQAKRTYPPSTPRCPCQRPLRPIPATTATQFPKRTRTHQVLEERTMTGHRDGRAAGRVVRGVRSLRPVWPMMRLKIAVSHPRQRLEVPRLPRLQEQPRTPALGLAVHPHPPSSRPSSQEPTCQTK